MATATWNGETIANSNETILVEDNHYFPRESVNFEFLRRSDNTSRCPWKGTANYYDVVVGDSVTTSAAWTYEDPLPEAANIKEYIAFWKGVEVTG